MAGVKEAPARREEDAGPAPDATRLLRRILEAARHARRPLVHLQHNPDPDAIASGVAMQFLLKRVLGLETVLTHTGQVGRAENRAMLRWLGIHIIPAFKIDYHAYDFLMVVDSHPGSGTCRLPPGVVPNVVVDHHPAPDMPEGVDVAFLSTDFGSTSTQVGWLLVENGIHPDGRVATALTYGIKTDTMDLSRTQGPHDERVYREIYTLADKRLLGRIQRARLSQEYFQVLERGLRRARVTDFTVTTYLGRVDHADAVAEISDILFRLEGTKWAMVAGHDGPLMYLSIRAVRAEGVNAGKVAEAISGGFGGGHETFAGAQVPIPADGTTPEEFFEVLWTRLMETVHAKKSLTRPLTVPPDARTPEDEHPRKRRHRSGEPNGPGAS
ncbi:MAG: bifunctional oligoribonuclease/PAP phosphatase NrnA [Planctomycetota bacterium]